MYPHSYRFINRCSFWFVIAFVFVLSACDSASRIETHAESATIDSESLLRSFREPPQSARPRTWWHWMNGNVTIDGIEKDLEWMHRVGLGGLQNFDAGLNTPQIVDERLIFMSDGWQDALRFAVSKADELGLEYSIPASPGWSETGGPWVPPADGMKKLVWSETVVRGGEPFNRQLPAPPNTTGPYQDVKYHDPLSGNTVDLPSHFDEVAVVAYPIGESPIPIPVASTEDGVEFDPAALLDSDLDTTFALPMLGERPSILYTFDEPVTVRSATVFVPKARNPFRGSPYLPILEAQTDDGWRQVGVMPLVEARTTIGFESTTARRFRLVVGPNTAGSGSPLGDGAPGAVKFDIFASSPPGSLPIAEWSLSAEARVNRAGSKAGYSIVDNYYELTPGAVEVNGNATSEQVVDLSDSMADDGTLNWTPPAGSNWRILRLGYSLTGKMNHPAAAEATGLEVDKYDGAAVRRYLETYISMYREALGDELVGASGLRGILTDSIEVDEANWTPRMIEQFSKLRGYDPTPWLPVLTGAVIGSPEDSDAFLYDFRRTLGDLLVNEHYKTVADVARENGMIVYGEALENMRPVLGDDIAMRKYTDVPMSAMWMYNRDAEPRSTLLGDMKGAASVAHLYGQNLVAAESMTSALSPWAFAPHDLKRVIDLEFAHGVNRPVIHTSVHQPVDDKQPGLSLMIFGQYFNRHETWAEMARPWIDYIARTSFMLQQGRDYADVAYFYGEEAPITVLFGESPPDDLPFRYSYDLVNADALQNVLSVEDGDLVAASGARYKVLFLSGTSEWMTLPTLKRVGELVEAGATVVGRPPAGSPSLADDADTFAAEVGRLWSDQTITPVGQGRVINGTDLESVLPELGVVPALDHDGTPSNRDVLFVQRRLDSGDIYFVNNRLNQPRTIEARFRVSGKRPQRWDAISGEPIDLSYRFDGEQTVVPLSMGPEDAFFVVFVDDTDEVAADVVVPSEKVVLSIDGNWIVGFQPGRGAPESITLEMPMPLNEHGDAGVRYFSGVSTWTTSFELEQDASDLSLDLGSIGDVAEVFVNGESAGVTWFPPYRVDVSDLLNTGTNTLEVRVANLWVNRLIGDKQEGATPLTFTAAPTYRPDAPLRPAGLMGPVLLIAADDLD